MIGGCCALLFNISYLRIYLLIFKVIIESQGFLKISCGDKQEGRRKENYSIVKQSQYMVGAVRSSEGCLLPSPSSWTANISKRQPGASRHPITANWDN